VDQEEKELQREIIALHQNAVKSEREREREREERERERERERSLIDNQEVTAGR
jgi:hypothetical protein